MVYYVNFISEWFFLFSEKVVLGPVLVAVIVKD